MNTGYDFGDCSVLFQNKDKSANMRLIFQSQDVWRPSSPLRSNLSFLWLQIFHCTSFYQDEVESNSCVLHWIQPHFQALFSVVTDNGMFMQMEFKHIEYTHSWKMIEESQLGNAISFVVSRISYGDCSCLSYYKWTAKEQCLSEVHAGGERLCSCCRHTLPWCHTSPNLVSLINCKKKGKRGLRSGYNNSRWHF